MSYRTLTERERSFLSKLLAIDHPDYSGLLEQLSELLVKELDCEGSLIAGDCVAGRFIERDVAKSLPYLGLGRDTDGVPVQFAVLIDGDRRIAALEVTKLDGSPLRTAIDPSELALKLDKPGIEL